MKLALLLVIFIISLFSVSCNTQSGLDGLPTSVPTYQTDIPSFTATPSPSTVFASPSPTPTQSPPTQEIIAEPTSTIVPTQTLMATVDSNVWPEESIIFLRDNTLYEWFPYSGEIQELAHGIDSDLVFATDFVAFTREVVPNQEYVLSIFHLSTKTEREVVTLASKPLTTSLSPTASWIAYALEDSADKTSLIVYAVSPGLQESLTGSSILEFTSPSAWQWYEGNISWLTENQLSWNDPSGIWLADLSTNPVKPIVAIQPSTNTFEHPDGSKPATRYIPYEWSPDGQYLVVVEYVYEGGPFVVINRENNRAFQIPDAYSGYVPDSVVWIDNTTLIHFSIGGFANIWHLDPQGYDLMSLDRSIQIRPGEFDHFLPLGTQHVRFSSSSVKNEPHSALYDLDLQTNQVVQLSQDFSLYPRPALDRWSPVFSVWSSNGQHALVNIAIEGGDKILLLDFLNGSSPIDITSTIGSDSCCWHWHRGGQE
jgi:hypothetical protein